MQLEEIEMKISLKGKNKAEVLAALYNNAKPLGLGFLQNNSTPMAKEEAEALLKEQTYFDYLNGRVLKVDLSGDYLDPWLYNRDNGQGVAERIVKSLKDEFACPNCKQSFSEDRWDETIAKNVKELNGRETAFIRIKDRVEGSLYRCPNEECQEKLITDKEGRLQLQDIQTIFVNGCRKKH